MSADVHYPFAERKTTKPEIDGKCARADDEAMSERVAALEATIGTIRAEIRADGAETRASLVTAVERLRTDTNREVLGLKIWALTAAITGALTVIGGLAAAITWIVTHLVLKQ